MEQGEIGGCLASLAVIGGVWWFFANYELKPKGAPAQVGVLQADRIPPEALYSRPTGMQDETANESGTVWRLDADSVRGNRRHRQGWLIQDASKDKTVTNWRTHKTLELVDCDTTAVRELASIFYDAEGKLPWPSEMKDANDAKPEYYPIGTIGYAPVRSLCSKNYDSPTSAQ